MTESLLGVLSDTHNNAANTDNALAVLRERGIGQLIHCGDLTGPAMLEHFGGFQVWLVRGNNDSDLSGLRSVARHLGNVHYCGNDAQLTFGSHKVAVCHGDDQSLVNTLACAGGFEWVFFGHSHRHEMDSVGSTRLLNPGALGGRHPGGESRSFAIVDLATSRAQFIPL